MLEEIVSLIEKEEDEGLKKEVDKRRMRLGAAGPEQLKKDVGREIWGKSQVRFLRNYLGTILILCSAPCVLQRDLESPEYSG